MPGRYGKPARTNRHGSQAKARPSLRFRFLGLAAGAACVASGVVALTSTADETDRPALSSPESTIDGTSQVVRDSGQISRSGSREPGRQFDTLDKPAIQDEPEDAAEDTESDEDEPEQPDETEDSPTPEPDEAEVDPDTKPEATADLPADSGDGRRIVFDITGQQVWLVEGDGSVERTYMVSGSRYDQLPEGTYEVFSKSEEAVSWTLEETMQYMVRFHRGENSNIGFHDIPVYKESGEEAQTLSELGTPLSDGCIRQDHEDAKALWEFAPVGTKVVVVRT
ncbi:L,D-transpeptidase family protein [Phytoactinopolyspora mesophila]|uniref:L,D-transpeptidase family protein n=1 Tax=Phytoactinopolyspora mesophila TaxID=2650750 RepID=A0A7K3M2B6_9ACTN|nr:L,D-transpeptidase family protein [Phytoactinopolyspora mesophila]NDL57390.1 L,D-transpeptidase family protein [Phytoactinopolyspora mesophila]